MDSAGPSDWETVVESPTHNSANAFEHSIFVSNGITNYVPPTPDRPGYPNWAIPIVHEILIHQRRGADTIMGKHDVEKELRHEITDLDRLAAEVSDVLAGGAKVPDNVRNNIGLHSALVTSGMNGYMVPYVMTGLAQNHPSGKGWKILNILDESSRTESNVRRELEKLLITEPTKHLVMPSNPGRHLTMVIRPANEKRLIFFDPNMGETAMGFGYHQANHRKTLRQAMDMEANTPHMKVGRSEIQEVLGQLHGKSMKDLVWTNDTEGTDYGMCAYLCATVLRRVMDNVKNGEPVDVDKAANELIASVQNDEKLARALDFYMISSSNRLGGVPTRVAQGMKLKTNKQRREEAEYERAQEIQAANTFEPVQYHLKRAKSIQKSIDSIDAQILRLKNRKYGALEPNQIYDLEDERQHLYSNRVWHDNIVERARLTAPQSKTKTWSSRIFGRQRTVRASKPSKPSHRHVLMVAALELALHRLSKRKSRTKKV